MKPQISDSANHQHPELKVEYRSTSSLLFDPANARLHSKQQLRQIAQSIKVFGFNVPVLIDSSSRVIAGHGQIAAADLIRCEKIPTIPIAHLSDAQRRAFTIAANRLTENSSWDSRLLGEQLKVLSEADLDSRLMSSASRWLR